MATGDRLSLVAGSTRARGRGVTGTWRADPADPYWLGEPLRCRAPSPAGRSRPAARVVVEADLAGRLAGRPLDAQWRAIPDLEGFRPETLDAVAAEGRGLRAGSTPRSRQSNQATVATKLPDILASVDRSVLVAQAGILLLLVQFGVLAGYAVILVAALLIDRRRTETALLRARGAGLRAPRARWRSARRC